MTEFTNEIVYINDLETLRVICDPLRLKIFRTISEINQNGDICTVKRISDELDIPPVKLYYHFKLLEAHGFIEVADTRIVSGILEKLYRVPAPRISISNDLFGSVENQETLYPMFAGLITDVLNDIRLILHNSHEENLQNNISISRRSLHLPINQAVEFTEKMEETLTEMEKERNTGSKEDLQTYTFFYACFPERKGHFSNKTQSTPPDIGRTDK